MQRRLILEPTVWHGDRHFGVIIHMNHQFHSRQIFPSAESGCVIVTEEGAGVLDAHGFPAVGFDEHRRVGVAQGSFHTVTTLVQEVCHEGGNEPIADSQSNLRIPQDNCPYKGHPVSETISWWAIL